MSGRMTSREYLMRRKKQGNKPCFAIYYVGKDWKITGVRKV